MDYVSLQLTLNFLLYRTWDEYGPPFVRTPLSWTVDLLYVFPDHDPSCYTDPLSSWSGQSPDQGPPPYRPSGKIRVIFLILYYSESNFLFYVNKTD